MDNYIVIDGRRIELTKEQVEIASTQLFKFTNWDRVISLEKYYYIDCDGGVYSATQNKMPEHETRLQVANYNTDYNTMLRILLEQNLKRKLERYRDKNDIGCINWNDKNNYKYYISLDMLAKTWFVSSRSCIMDLGVVYFASANVVESAIEEFSNDLDKLKVYYL